MKGVKKELKRDLLIPLGKNLSLGITGGMWFLTLLAMLSFPLLAIPMGIIAILVTFAHLNIPKEA